MLREAKPEKTEVTSNAANALFTTKGIARMIEVCNWLWLKKPVQNGKWKHGPEPANHLLFNFEPQPYSCLQFRSTCIMALRSK